MAGQMGDRRLNCDSGRVLPSINYNENVVVVAKHRVDLIGLARGGKAWGALCWRKPFNGSCNQSGEKAKRSLDTFV